MGWREPVWFRELPAIAGRWVCGVSLAEFTTLKVGGDAEVFGELAGWEDLQVFLRWNVGGGSEGLRSEALRGRVPFTVLGKGSNVMIGDGGIAGVVVVLSKGFDAVETSGQVVRWSGGQEEAVCVYAEAGAATGTAARAAREAGLTGLEFFGGIPGSIGGALVMNAGAYGGETYRDLVRLWVLDEAGNEHEKEPGFVKPGYRHTELPAGWLYKAGLWRLRAGDKEEIRQKMRAINHSRASTQPLHLPSSGSWFKNVLVTQENVAALRAGGLEADVGAKVNAWRIVDAVGARGKRVGGAMVSEEHANFFVNAGGATARDFEALSGEIEAAIWAKFGVRMQREVRKIGE